MKLVAASAIQAQAAAPLIYQSGHNSLDALFHIGSNSRAVDFIAYAFAQNGGQFSYSQHHVLLHQGELVGIGSSWTDQAPPEHRQATLDCLVRFFGADKLLLILQNSGEIEKVIPYPAPTDLCVGHLAIAPAYRGKGHIALLLDHFAEQAASLNKQTLILDVESHNQAAIRAYEKYGFSTVSERLPTHRGTQIGLTPHLRMQLSV